MSARPSIDADTIRAALQGSNWDPEEVKAITDACGELFRYRRYVDGYELARHLDDRCGWDMDADTVERLDNVQYRVREEHDRRCWAWVREHNIQPPFPVGTVIKEGTITGVSKHSPATFEVLMPGDEGSTRRRLIQFEDARHA